MAAPDDTRANELGVAQGIIVIRYLGLHQHGLSCVIYLGRDETDVAGG